MGQTKMVEDEMLTSPKESFNLFEVSPDLILNVDAHQA